MPDTIFLHYVGGLPIGKPGGVWMTIEDDHLVLEHKEKRPENCWSYELRFADISSVSTQTGESLSAMRLALVGMAFAFKKDPYLVITARVGRLEASVVLHSTRQQVERAYQRVFQAASATG